MTGECVASDRAPVDVCEIQSWCPVEIDRLPMDPKTEGPLITGQRQAWWHGSAGFLRSYESTIA